MTENAPQTDPTDATVEAEVVVEQNFVQRFANRRPRAAKIIAITGAVLAAAGTLTVANTARKNSHHVDNALDHVVEAGSELSQAVSPTPETTDA